MIPSTPQVCPSCGRELGTGALTGLCAACTWDSLCDEGDASLEIEPDGPVMSEHLGHHRHIAGHEILGEIGRGGGGIVYRARQAQPRREVALKILPSGLLHADGMRERFRAEAATVAALDHPGILPVYGSGEHDGMPYFTMKLAAGGSLAARRDALHGRWREIAGLVADLADAVQHAHERGVIHRDLKPGNVLFDEAGRAFVSDFGLAKFVGAGAVGADLTQPLAVLGTPAYLAPEAAEHGAAATTVSADIYSLGAILYELLVGRPPFAADSIVSLLRQIAVQPPPAPRRLDAAVPRDLEVICLHAMAKEPAGRFATAGAFAADLRRWLERRPIESRPVPLAERAWFWARRHPAPAALSLALALGLVAGGAVLTESNRRLRVAQAESREQLRAALMSEARLLRQSGVQGQHFEALAVLERAAAMRGGIDVRSEIAGALSRPDLRLAQSVPAVRLGEMTVSAFSPGLDRYLDLAEGGGFAVRRTADGEQLLACRTEGTAAPDNFAFSADGRRVRVSFRRGNHEVWDVERGVRLWSGGRGPVALHPTEPRVVHGGESGVRVIECGDGGSETALPAVAPETLALAFSPDGARLAAVSAQTCEIVDVRTGGIVARLTLAGNATPPAWSVDGTRLAIGAAPGHSVAIIDVAGARVVQTLRNPTALLVGLQFHPDGRRVLTLGRDNTLRLWDALSGAELVRASIAPRALTVAADGRRIGAAVSERELGLFELAAAPVTREFLGRQLSGGQAHTAAVSPDDAWLATCDEHEIRVWDVAHGREVASFPFADPDLASVHFAPDGAALVYGGTSRGVFRRIIHPATGAGALTLGLEQEIGPERSGRPMGFTRDGSDWFIDREGDGKVVVWPGGDPARERVVATTGRSERPEFSPDGRWIVTMGYRQVNVQLWCTDNASVVHKLPIRRHSGAEFSPDGRWLLISNMEEIRLWRFPECTPAHTWPTHGRGGLGWGTTAFSPDASLAAVEQEGGQIGIFDVVSGAERITLPALPVAGLSHIVWSRDGTRLFLYHDDHRVVAWEIAALRRELAARGLDW